MFRILHSFSRPKRRFHTVWHRPSAFLNYVQKKNSQNSASFKSQIQIIYTAKWRLLLHFFFFCRHVHITTTHSSGAHSSTRCSPNADSRWATQRDSGVRFQEEDQRTDLIACAFAVTSFLEKSDGRGTTMILRSILNDWLPSSSTVRPISSSSAHKSDSFALAHFSMSSFQYW